MNINIDTKGGPVITGGIFNGTTFIANQVNNTITQNPNEAMINAVEDAAEVPMEEKPLPKELDTPQARACLEKAKEGGLLDEHFQPIDLSATKMAWLAHKIAEKAKMHAFWDAFAQLWGKKGNSLRSAYGKGREQKQMLDFQGKLKEILS